MCVCVCVIFEANFCYLFAPRPSAFLGGYYNRNLLGLEAVPLP